LKGDGIWGSICGVIGSAIGIAAGCMNDRYVFKALYIAHSTLSAIGICLSLCALTLTACGLYWSWGLTYSHWGWTLIGIWIGEGVFLLGVLICSSVAACRIGCWCCLDDNLIEPLTVVDADILPEGQVTSAQVMVDQNQNATVVQLAEPEAIFAVDSTTA